MLGSTNFWMAFAGLVYLAAGFFMVRREVSTTRGWDRLIALAPVLIAASLAAFAPEHFRGPNFIKEVVPSWLPARWFWPYFVGCALLAAATSLTARKFVRLSSSLLGVMFFLFVCMIYLRFALAHPAGRFGWTYVLRDLSFCAGALAIAGLNTRDTSPQPSKWMIVFARGVIAIAAIFYGVEHFLHPDFAPGIPLELKTPSWVPVPSVWAFAAGAVLVSSGIALVLNKKPRIAAAVIGALMIALTLLLYIVILFLARGEPAVNEALNYVADTLLYAGSALALASAMPKR